LRGHLLLAMWFFFFHLTNIYLSLDWELGILLWFNRSHLMDLDACAGSAIALILRAVELAKYHHRRCRKLHEFQSSRPRSIATVENCDCVRHVSRLSRTPRTKLKRDVLIQRQREGVLARLMNIKTASDS